MSCFICFEKGENFCNECSKRVCLFDSATRAFGSVKLVYCNFCSFKGVRENNLLDIQKIHSSLVEKLQGLENSNANIGLEINALVDTEISYSEKLENLKNLYEESLSQEKNKLNLEETSRNNALQSSFSLYKAIKTLESQISSLQNELDRVKSRNSYLNMLNCHKTREVSFLIAKSKANTQSNLIALSAAFNMLCETCKIKIFRISNNVSVLEFVPEREKACGTCSLA